MYSLFSFQRPKPAVCCFASALLPSEAVRASTSTIPPASRAVSTLSPTYPRGDASPVFAGPADPLFALARARLVATAFSRPPFVDGSATLLRSKRGVKRVPVPPADGPKPSAWPIGSPEGSARCRRRTLSRARRTRGRLLGRQGSGDTRGANFRAGSPSVVSAAFSGRRAKPRSDRFSRHRGREVAGSSRRGLCRASGRSEILLSKNGPKLTAHYRESNPSRDGFLQRAERPSGGGQTRPRRPGTLRDPDSFPAPFRTDFVRSSPSVEASHGSSASPAPGPPWRLPGSQFTHPSPLPG